MDIATRNRMVAEDIALRRKQILQPMGGNGDKIFPPTYRARGVIPRRPISMSAAI